MRIIPVFVGLSAVMLVNPTVGADFIFSDPVGTYHLGGQAFDETGNGVNFDWQGEFGTGDDDRSDYSETFGQFTYSGAAYLSSVTSTSIDLRGFTQATGGLDSSVATAFAGITMTFVIESARLVNVDYFTFLAGEEGAYATISFNGPNGAVPVGMQTLDPGVYTFSGAAGFTQLPLPPGSDTTYARFFFLVEQVPSPGPLAVFAATGFIANRRRRTQ